MTNVEQNIETPFIIGADFSTENSYLVAMAWSLPRPLSKFK